MEKRDVYVFYIELNNGSELKVFVTNTYFFTNYSLEKILEIDPGIDAIICSNPYSAYTSGAKQECITKKIGLFTLRDFMGALNYVDVDNVFLNYLISDEKEKRVSLIKNALLSCKSNMPKIEIYLFGSFLRTELYNDIDLLVVHEKDLSNSEISRIETEVKMAIEKCIKDTPVDIEITDSLNFSSIKMENDNKCRVL